MNVCVPAILNWHVWSLPNRNLLKNLNRKNKMRIRRVTLPASIRRKSVIRSTKISCRNDNRRPRDAPPEILHTPDFVTRAADLSFFEQNGAQSSSRFPISAPLQITIPARATDCVTGISFRVIRRPGGFPFRQRWRWQRWWVWCLGVVIVSSNCE